MRKFISAIVVGSLLTLSMTTLSFASPVGDAAIAVKACKTDVDCAAAIAQLKAAAKEQGLPNATVASLLIQAETRVAGNLGVTVEQLRLSPVVGQALTVAFADFSVDDIQTAGNAPVECSLDSASASDGGGC